MALTLSNQKSSFATEGDHASEAFEFRGRKFINRNPVLTMNIGGDGLKTGQTEASGFGLVGSALQNGRRLLLVVNGLKSNEERTAEVRKLFEWGFKNFGEFKLFDGEHDEMSRSAIASCSASGRARK